MSSVPRGEREKIPGDCIKMRRFAVAHLTSYPSIGLTGKPCLCINDRAGETLTDELGPHPKLDLSSMSLVIQGFHALSLLLLVGLVILAGERLFDRAPAIVHQLLAHLGEVGRLADYSWRPIKQPFSRE